MLLPIFKSMSRNLLIVSNTSAHSLYFTFSFLQIEFILTRAMTIKKQRRSYDADRINTLESRDSKNLSFFTNFALLRCYNYPLATTF
jgi:hypothetical protein